jgi:hypothetical protein
MDLKRIQYQKRGLTYVIQVYIAAEARFRQVKTLFHGYTIEFPKEKMN